MTTILNAVLILLIVISFGLAGYVAWLGVQAHKLIHEKDDGGDTGE